MSFGGSVKLTGESEYRKALAQITQNLKEVSSEMKVVNSAYDKNDKSEQAQIAKKEVLNKQLTEQAKKIDVLKQEYDELSKSEDADEKSLSKLRIEINNAQTAYNKTAKEMDNLGKESKETGDEIEKAGKQSADADKKIGGLGETASKVGKALGVAVVAIGTATITAGKKLWDMANSASEAGDDIDKSSQKMGVSAEKYQQLSYAMERSGASVDDFKKGMVGIRDALADAENGVEGADKKWQALGISLKNADGTMKSTEDVLLESIDALASMENETQRNALAQDIFGKSASELAPLLNSGSDGIKALMQEAKDYGMVMSDEAVKSSAEFQDSLTRMKGTMSGLKNNMVGGLLPSLKMVTDGFADLIAGNEGASESIKKGMTGTIKGITKLIPQFVTLISSIAQAVMESAPEILRALANGILGAIPTLMPTVVSLITDLVKMIIELLPELIDTGMKIILALIEGLTEALPTLIAMIPDMINGIVTAIIDNLPLIIDAGIELVLALTDGILEALPRLIEMIPTLVVRLVDTLLQQIPKIIDAGIKLLTSLVDAMPTIIDAICKALPALITGLINGIMSNLPKIIDAGIRLFSALVQNIPAIVKALVKALPQIISALIKGFTDALPQMANVGLNLIQGIWNGIKNAGEWIMGKIKEFMGNIVGGIKRFFGIASPSKLFRDQIGANLALGIGEGFTDEMKDVTKDMQEAMPTSLDVCPTINGSGVRYGEMDMVSAFKEALSEMKIELDDEVAGRFVDQTVTRLVYS